MSEFAETETEDRKVTIRQSLLEEARHKIELANRRLVRAGIAERFVLAVGEPREVSYTGNGGVAETYWMVDVELSSPAISYSGWTFVATLSFEEAGTVVRTVPGQECDYRPDHEACDQCGTVRLRNETFVVRNEKSGEYRQVGRNCLALFLGVKPGSLWALSYSIEDMDESDADEEARSSWGGVDRSLDVRRVVAASLAASEEGRGYVSAASEYKTSTKVKVSDVLWGRFEREVGRFAEAARARNAWLTEMRDRTTKYLADGSLVSAVIDNAAEMRGDSTYAENCRILARCERTGAANLGLVVSFVSSWDKAQEWAAERKEREERKAAKRNEWIGSEGDKKVRTEGTLTKVRYIEGDYGTTTLLEWVTEDGLTCKWFRSGYWSHEAGEKIAATGTIKKHETYEGWKSTVFTRCKLEEEK